VEISIRRRGSVGRCFAAALRSSAPHNGRPTADLVEIDTLRIVILVEDQGGLELMTREQLAQGTDDRHIVALERAIEV
jgi:hypothetical protein